MPAELAAPAPAADEVVAAVWVLRDPELPGEPWPVEAIARILPLLAEGLAGRAAEQGPPGLEAEAWGARWLAAADEGALPEDD